MEKEINWFAVHTMQNYEKKVSSLLAKQNIENYCPVTKITSNSFFAKKEMSMPLLPTLVFIYTTPSEHDVIRHTNGVVNFLFWLSAPAIIKPDEIAAIKHYATDRYSLAVKETPVNPMEDLNIVSCLFTGVGEDGLLVNEKYVKIYLPSLGYSISAVPTNKIRAVKTIGKFEEHLRRTNT